MAAQDEYRDWILTHTITGHTFSAHDKDHLELIVEDLRAQVIFYDLDGTIVAELLIEREHEEAPLFFLHFELNDLDRAHELFDEMCEVIKAALEAKVFHVLLCCTCGITTTFFANKLNETAKQLSIDYDFCARSVEEAMQIGHTFSAVLLAPQVGHMADKVQQACPNTVVIALPARLFGAYDAAGTLQLVVNAVLGARKAAATDLRMARDIDRSKRVLAISYVHRTDEPTLSWRIMEAGELTHSDPELCTPDKYRDDLS